MASTSAATVSPVDDERVTYAAVLVGFRPAYCIEYFMRVWFGLVALRYDAS